MYRFTRIQFHERHVLVGCCMENDVRLKMRHHAPHAIILTYISDHDLELCKIRQLRAYQPKRVIILDQAETPLFEFEQELTALPNLAPFEIVIGDVCQYDRMRRMM
ncbi:MAG: polysaccharide biosynthesis protein, partial [Flavobacteriales bacterium]